jgi:hypothetical protein
VTLRKGSRDCGDGIMLWNEGYIVTYVPDATNVKDGKSATCCFLSLALVVHM